MVKVSTNGKTVEVAYKPEATVADVFNAANVQFDGKKATVEVNGKSANLKTPVNDQSIVTITPNVDNG